MESSIACLLMFLINILSSSLFSRLLIDCSTDLFQQNIFLIKYDSLRLGL